MIANLGGFYRDYAVGGKGVVAPVKSVIKVKQAVKTADAPAAPAAASTEDTYVRGVAKFIPEFQKVYAEMPDEISVAAGKDLYSSPEFVSAVRDAIMQAYDAQKASDKEFMGDLVDSLKFKNAFVKSDVAASKEGEGTGEIPTVDGGEDQTPVDILRDLGTWNRASGFDDFDKFSSI